MMNNENGRSMVEMLGVLAIIGVLSVAGIAGYTIAMNKYRSNEILNHASQVVMMAKAANGGAGAADGYTTANSGITPPMSGVSVTVNNATGDTPSVTVSGMSNTSVCNNISAASPGSGIYTISCSS